MLRYLQSTSRHGVSASAVQYSRRTSHLAVLWTDGTDNTTDVPSVVSGYSFFDRQSVGGALIKVRHVSPTRLERRGAPVSH